MNQVEMSSGSMEPITLLLDGAQIERVKELHLVRIANGWDVQFAVEPEPPQPEEKPQ